MAEALEAAALDDQAFNDALQARVVAKRQRQIEKHSETMLLWLALAPVWPRQFVQAGFPTSDGMVTGEAAVSAVEGAVIAGLVSSQVSFYEMPQAQRDWILSFEQKQPRGLQRILGELTQAAQAMRRASSGKPLDEDLERWCRFGEAGLTERDKAAVLDREIEAAILAAESRKATVCPEARRWIEIAEPIAELFAGPLRIALMRARRRFELFHRRAKDLRFLQNFHRREAQVAAFDELLDSKGPDEPWALHYVGSGGAGKTMLIRHITAQLAPERGLASARIDFDHINPDYPSHAPALLLAAFAEELRLYEKSTPVFNSFYSIVDTIHEAVDARGGTAGRDEAMREVEPALNAFIDAIRDLGMTPLLILDTCEELATLRPNGAIPDNVRVTFDILERLHAALPDLRVVFSGRRPLAAEGRGWKCPQSLLPARSYLRLHVVSGFTRDESLEFLGSYHDGDRKVDPALFEAILERSPASDTTLKHRFEVVGGEKEQRARERYNPYDLDDYALQAIAGRLGDSAHHYVKERILEHLSPLLVPLVPALVTVGTFDRELIGLLLRGLSVDQATLVEELSQNHWIVSIDSDAEETLWSVDDHHRKRFLAYYEDEEHSQLLDGRSQLAGILPTLTLERPWRKLSVAFFDAALQLLQHDVSSTLDWWQRVEQKIARDGEWDWALRLTGQLLATEDGSLEEAAAKVPDPLIRGSILATQAAALARLDRADEVLWQHVLDTLASVADPRAAWLRRRARAGIVNALQWSRQPLGKLVNRIADCFADEPDATVESTTELAVEIALLEGAVEILERVAADRWIERDTRKTAGELARRVAVRFSDWSADRLPDENSYRPLDAFHLSLQARLAAFQQRVDDAEKLFRRSLANLNEGTPIPRTLDWSPPQDPVARLRLEAVRGLALRFDVGKVLVPESHPPGGSLDSDRLAAALQLVRLAGSVEPRMRIPSPALPPLGTARAMNRCNAHREIPSYLSVEIELLAAEGDIHSAWKRCGDAMQVAEQTADVLLQSELARLQARLICRCRLFENGDEPSRLVLALENRIDEELTVLYSALSGKEHGIPLYARFAALAGKDFGPPEDRPRYTYLLSRRQGPKAGSTRLFAIAPIRSSSSFVEVWLALDAADESDVGADSRANTFKQALDWARSSRSDPAGGLRIAVRLFNRKVPSGNLRDVFFTIGDRVGHRRGAGIIVEECVLAAVSKRLVATEILTIAAEWFRAMNDSFGAFRATVVAAMATNPTVTPVAIIASIPPGPSFPSADLIMNAVRSSRRVDQLTEFLDRSDPLFRPWNIRAVAACLALGDKTSHHASARFERWLRRSGEDLAPDLTLLLRTEEKPSEEPTPSSISSDLITLVVATALFSGLVALLWFFAGAWAVSTAAVILLGVVTLGSKGDTRDMFLGFGVITFGWLALYWAAGFIPGNSVFGRHGSFGSILSFSLIISLIAYAISQADRLARWRDSIRRSLASRLVIDVRREAPSSFLLADGVFPETPDLLTESQRDQTSSPLAGSLTLQSLIGAIKQQLVLRGDSAQLKKEEPYILLRNVLADETTASLDQWMTAAWRSPLPARLDLASSDLATVCWEAMLDPTRFGENASDAKRLAIYRTVPVRTARPVAQGPGPMVASGAAFANEAWIPIVAAGLTFARVEMDQIKTARALVVHVGGIPSVVQDGIRLQFGDEMHRGRSGLLLPDFARDTRTAAGNIALPESSLLGPNFARDAAAFCCIVQGLPNDSPRRTGTDRITAGQLRQFGAEVFASGVPLVIVIPALPTDLSISAVGYIAQALAGRRWKRIENVLESIDEMRLRIMHAATRDLSSLEDWQLDPNAAAELAHDVCVYMKEPNLRRLRPPGERFLSMR